MRFLCGSIRVTNLVSIGRRQQRNVERAKCVYLRSDCAQLHTKSLARLVFITDTCNRLRREIQPASVTCAYICTMILSNFSLVYMAGRKQCTYNLEARPCNHCCRESIELSSMKFPYTVFIVVCALFGCTIFFHSSS